MPCATPLTLASVQQYYNLLLTQTELRLSTLMRECTAIIYTLLEYEILILGSKHPTLFFTDHKPIIYLFKQKSNSNHRVYSFHLILMKFANLDIVWTARTNLALPDTLSRKIPPKIINKETTVKIPQNIKFLLAKDETSPRLQCKYAVKSDTDQSQFNNLQHFFNIIRLSKQSPRSRPTRKI